MKINQFKKKMLLGTFLFAFLSLSSNLLKADPPPWAPAYGHREHEEEHEFKHARKYHYVYYPASQVYYSPVVRRYYYLNGGNWVYGPSVPVDIHLGKSVSIELGGPVPYVYHPTVIQQYPVMVVP